MERDVAAPMRKAQIPIPVASYRAKPLSHHKNLASRNPAHKKENANAIF